VPFWTATGRTGIDAFGASGLLGTGDGEVRFFSVCLGGYCPYAIETHECVQPAIRNASGIAEFSCAG